MIRLIASDLDGTLLADHHHIHPDNLAQVRGAMAQGVRFVAISGRSAANCSLILKDHGLMDAMIIGTNGCETMEKPFGRTLARHFMPPEAAQEAMALFARYDLDGCLYTERSIAYTTDRMIRVESRGAHEAFTERMRAAGTQVGVGPDAIARALAERPMKAYCIYRPGQEAAFAAAREAASRFHGLTVTSSWPNNFEVMPAGVDKGAALRALCEGLRISPGEVIAFGDSENDLPMLRWVGQAFAMANAQASVLREVARTTDRCDEGGVARALRAHGVGPAGEALGGA